MTGIFKILFCLIFAKSVFCKFELQPNLDRSDNINRVNISFDEYPRYADVKRYLMNISQEYSNFVRYFNIGRTHEDRDIMMVKIGKRPRQNKNKAVWIDAGIHGREWIAPITSLYLIDKLLKKFNSGEKSVFTRIDWYFIPLVNPDGYEFTHTNMSNRFWRKNRSPNIHPNATIQESKTETEKQCMGVELNYNFDTYGYGNGASNDPCQDNFNGYTNNSEPEVMALTQKLEELKNNVRILLSLHSYGQHWLIPWGFNLLKAVDHDNMMRLGKKATKAIKKINNRTYTVELASKVFSSRGGSFLDFAKFKMNIAYPVSVVLPESFNPTAGHDAIQSGFHLNASKIRGVGEEIWAAMEVVGKAAKNMP